MRVHSYICVFLSSFSYSSFIFICFFNFILFRISFFLPSLHSFIISSCAYFSSSSLFSSSLSCLCPSLFLLVSDSLIFSSTSCSSCLFISILHYSQFLRALFTSSSFLLSSYVSLFSSSFHHFLRPYTPHFFVISFFIMSFVSDPSPYFLCSFICFIPSLLRSLLAFFISCSLFKFGVCFFVPL